MDPSPNGTTRNLNPNKHLGFLLLFIFSASSILYSQSILQSFRGDWSNNDYNDDDDDDDEFDGVGLRGIQRRETSEPNEITTIEVSSSSSNWTSTWLNAIPSDHHASPYILYVHVGKTGGIALERGIPISTRKVIATLKCIVRMTATNISLHDARQSCLHQIYRNQATAELAKHVLAHKHLWSTLYKSIPQLPNLMDFAMKNLDTILITTRNPVDRVVSNFNYQRNELVEQYVKKTKSREEKEKIQNSQHKFSGKGMKESFYNCFADVRYMAEELVDFFHLNQNDTNSQSMTLRTTSSNNNIVYNNMNCGQLAMSILSFRRAGGLSHYTSNYRWYKQLTIDERPEVPVLVVRTEYLWQDTTNIEVALGGKSSNFMRSHHTMSHGSEKYAVTARLETDLQRKAVCCAIYDDLQAYQDIVLSALNLDKYEKRETMISVYRDCSVDHDVSDSDTLYGTKFWKTWFASNCNRRSQATM